MKSKRINIKVTPEDHTAIEQRASELNLGISEYIRRLVLVDIATKK